MQCLSLPIADNGSWPEALGGDADLSLGLGFGETLLKRGVVSGLLKEREPSHTTVQHVIGEVSGGEACGSSTENTTIPSRKRLPTPFLVPAEQRCDALVSL